MYQFIIVGVLHYGGREEVLKDWVKWRRLKDECDNRQEPFSFLLGCSSMSGVTITTTSLVINGYELHNAGLLTNIDI